MDTFRRGPLVFDVRDGGPADGEPVVLLHGFPQDSSAYDRLATALHGQGFRTLAPDQRGYSPGARPTGRSAYALRELVDDVRALLDSAGLRSAHVVGHDWGAVVAWALAAWHPERVRTLTALSVPHPAAFSRALITSPQALMSTYIAFFQLPALPERVLLAGNGTPLTRLLETMGLHRDHAERYVARMREPGALTAALDWYRALPFSARAMAGTRGRGTVGRITVPTLHVWSSGDPALSRAGAEATGRYVDAPYQLEVLLGVPHWIPEVAAEHTAGLVVAHARTHG
ncbi:alpha/beta fold hydrolase [Goekera deserti]|uniref:alpha/beta fold hydrolase n=1 Tax=Goekera deserti TaxID=2497753 RepID=UPI00192EB2CA|nr:alpha/beta fold hydrolase [Goekera deserti]